MTRHAEVAIGITAVLATCAIAATPVQTLDILADKDSRYRINGKASPTISLKAGETIHLRITAKKAKTWNRDGSIHGFALLRVKDRVKVEGWDLLLRPGMQDFDLKAPDESGEYEVVCTVICSDQHEQMHMKVVVER